jgi:predicted membrane protein
LRFWQNNEEAGAAFRVSRDIPVTVDIKLSLSSLKVDMLPSSELRIDSSLGNVRVDMTHPEGNCEAYIHATMSNIEVIVPYDIAARFSVDSDFGSVDMDEAIFIRQDGSYVTRNFEQAADGLDVKIDSQFSRVKVSKQPVKVYISSAY